MRLRVAVLAFFLAAPAVWAGIVENVRVALMQNNYGAAEAQLNSYRTQRGVDPEYLEAYSWLGRAALDQGQYDQAAAYAKETNTLALEQLKQRPVDAEPHLPWHWELLSKCNLRCWLHAGSGRRRLRSCRELCGRMERLPSMTGFRRISTCFRFRESLHRR